MPAPEYIPGGYTAVTPSLVAEDAAGRSQTPSARWSACASPGPMAASATLRS